MEIKWNKGLNPCKAFKSQRQQMIWSHLFVSSKAKLKSWNAFMCEPSYISSKHQTVEWSDVHHSFNYRNTKFKYRKNRNIEFKRLNTRLCQSEVTCIVLPNLDIKKFWFWVRPSYSVQCCAVQLEIRWIEWSNFAGNAKIQITKMQSTKLQKKI